MVSRHFLIPLAWTLLSGCKGEEELLEEPAIGLYYWTERSIGVPEGFRLFQSDPVSAYYDFYYYGEPPFGLAVLRAEPDHFGGAILRWAYDEFEEEMLVTVSSLLYCHRDGRRFACKTHHEPDHENYNQILFGSINSRRSLNVYFGETQAFDSPIVSITDYAWHYNPADDSGTPYSQESYSRKETVTKARWAELENQLLEWLESQ